MKTRLFEVKGKTFITKAPHGGAFYVRKCFFSKDEAFVRHYIN
jgi:hypothetical protein